MNANTREFISVACVRKALKYVANTYYTVIPAKAGIHVEQSPDAWVPAFAGTTKLNFLR